MENFENILESILFVAGNPVDISDITSKLDVSKKEVLDAVKKLKERYGEQSGISILVFGTKLQLSTNRIYSEQVAKVMNPIRQRNLSRATLETLSIVAYKQPITRLEIEEIRGVASDYAINILLEHKLIDVIGRKETVGHPLLFGTTDEFLKRFDLQNLDQLPDYETLIQMVENERAEKQKQAGDGLYHEYDVPTEKIVSEEEKTKEVNSAKPKIDFGSNDFV